MQSMSETIPIAASEAKINDVELNLFVRIHIKGCQIKLIEDNR